MEEATGAEARVAEDVAGMEEDTAARRRDATILATEEVPEAEAHGAETAVDAEEIAKTIDEEVATKTEDEAAETEAEDEEVAAAPQDAEADVTTPVDDDRRLAPVRSRSTIKNKHLKRDLLG